MRKFSRSVALLTLMVLSAAMLYAQPGTWAVSAGGEGQETPSFVISDANGNTYVASQFRDTAIVGSQTLISAGQNDFFVAKYDKDGNNVWVNRYGWLENERVIVMRLGTNGDLWVGGEFQDSCIFATDTLSITFYEYDEFGISDGLQDMFLMKLDTNGNYSYTVRGGGWGSEFLWDMEIEPSGNIIATGGFNTELRSNLGPLIMTNDGYMDVIIMRFDPLTQQWIDYRKAGGRLYESATQMSISDDSIHTFCGYFQDTTYFRDSTIYLATPGDEDMFLVQYSDSGNFKWVKQYGGPSLERPLTMEQDANGNFYMAGYFQDTMDIQGNTFISAGNLDGWIAKFDPNGDFLWGKTLSGPEFESIQDLVISDDGTRIMATGYFQGTASMGSFSMSSTDVYDQDVFFVSLDPQGNIDWIRAWGGRSVDAGRSITMDASGYAYIWGEYGDSAYFGDAKLVSSGALDAFLIRVDPNGSVSTDDIVPGSMPILTTWPNPAGSELNFRVNDLKGESLSVQIFDLNGREVYLNHPGYQTGTFQRGISTENWPSGLYFLNVSGDSFRITQQIAIQR